MNIGKPYEELVQVATTMQTTLKRLQKEADKKGSLKDKKSREDWKKVPQVAPFLQVSRVYKTDYLQESLLWYWSRLRGFIGTDSLQISCRNRS